MTTNILPVSNVINVTITNTPLGLTEKNVNSLAIFTNDTPTNGETYGIYINVTQVAENYGTTTDTYKMATNIFAQIPNILSGNGRLVIIPMLAAVDATHGTFSQNAISANLAGILSVSDGSVDVDLDGVTTSYTGLDFTNGTTWNDVASVLDSVIQDATVTSLTNGILITSKKVGDSSDVDIASNATGTDLYGASYLNGATGVVTSGADSSGETIQACINRTSGLVGYVPIISTVDIEDDAIVTAAAAVQALDNMLYVPRAQTTDVAGLATTIKNASDDKTRVLVYTESLVDAKLMAAAYAGRAHSVYMTGSNTAQTMNLKSLTNVTPDTGISQTLYTAAKTAGADLYVSYDGVPSVLSTGGNDFFDNVYMDLALKFYLETAGFNYLRQTNTKVPQTESGMNGLKEAYRKICRQFVTNGYVAPGSWTSSETFGDPETFTKNITNNGFYIYSQPIAQQSSTEREAREAPLVQIAIKRAGAIHTSDVIVNVNS
jgi:hypothetical protein